jgi:hypothetical protein
MNREQRRRLKRTAQANAGNAGITTDHTWTVEGTSPDRDKAIRLLEAGGCTHCNATVTTADTPDGVIVNIGHATGCPRLDAIRRRQ